eukprot:TRINITY_DN13393_c0_g1_i4.p1 TRINITY_DN13393_c0_g1~~TRINITY_DN13393_c0_g1_i4.p1  ORF type:complete len:173 (-),score=22.23 TRINITY_DN13393_c0_g1_i4:43-537(-)
MGKDGQESSPSFAALTNLACSSQGAKSSGVEGRNCLAPGPSRRMDEGWETARNPRRPAVLEATADGLCDCGYAFDWFVFGWERGVSCRTLSSTPATSRATTQRAAGSRVLTMLRWQRVQLWSRWSISRRMLPGRCPGIWCCRAQGWGLIGNRRSVWPRNGLSHT